MVRILEAIEFLGRAESGRSRPMYCRCVDQDNSGLNVYVKYIGFHEDLSAEHLVVELIANQLAQSLNLPACEPVIVKISSDFVDSLDGEGAADLRNAFGYGEIAAFGSVAVSSLRRWSAENIIHTSQKESALSVYVFDTLCENSDRGLGNPNLLQKGDNFVVMDFGHAFQSCWTENFGHQYVLPWMDGGITNHFPGNMQHALFSKLSAKDLIHCERIFDRWRDLSDATVDNYVRTVPNEWGRPTADKIVAYLGQIRENLDECETQIRRMIV